MPHATMKLIPGIDTYKTPALNEAAFSESQLIRFVPDRSGMGLVQKMGGWVDWATQGPISGTIMDIHPWQNLVGDAALAVGAEESISVIDEANRNNNVITPQKTTSNSPKSTYTVAITNATPSVVTATGSSYPPGTPIVFSTTGTLPSPLAVNTVYYVASTSPTPTANDFGVSTTVGGTGIATTTAGSGVHTVTVPLASTTSGSSIVTIYDTGLGSSFCSASFTSASPTVVTSTLAITSNTAVVFRGGSLPTGVTAGTTYYAVSLTPTTFNLSTTSGGAANVNTSTTGTGEIILSASFTNGSPTVVTTAVAPTLDTGVVFYGTSLPTGVSQGTTYYVQPLTATTFNISTTTYASGTLTLVSTTSTGTGAIYTPNQLRAGFSSWIKTPISISNLIVSGVYSIQTVIANSYFNIYDIDVGTVATSTTTVSTLPEFDPDTNFSTIVVTQANHPYQDGFTATFLTSTTSAGVTIYGNYFTTYISSTQYQITASSAATNNIAFNMNLGSAQFDYYYNIPSAFSALGYGSGFYGGGGYGAGIAISYPSAPTITTTNWTINNFGEILTANVQNGEIYYWSPTSNTTTMFLLETAPIANTGHFIAMPSRQVVAYGSTVTGIQDSLLIRWSEAGDATVWQASANNQAGSFRIAEGSAIVGGIQASQQALIWTDLALWAMQYIGYPNVFGFNKLADGVGLIAQKAVGILGRATYWMSPGGFNVLSEGGPQDMACPVWDQIFQNLNTSLDPNGFPYSNLIQCATNSIFDEVMWFYPSTNSTYNDSYVKYNTLTQAWDYGTLDRVAWCDQSVLGPPLGADSDGYIWQHEIGYDAGFSPMVSSFETGYMQLNDADNLIFIDQIWPDFKWQTTEQQSTNSATSATMYLTFYGADYPGDTPTQYGPYTMTQQTQYLSVRIRNRLLRISCSTANANGVALNGTFFRIGALRYRAQLDGKF